jgi:hypothetical protein
MPASSPGHIATLAAGAGCGVWQKQLKVGDRRSSFAAVADRKAYRTVCDEIWKAETESPLMKHGRHGINVVR